MLSINNFFGADLEKLPNHTSKYLKCSTDSDGNLIKEYTYIIDENVEDYFFKSLGIYIVENKERNFLFDNIPYDKLIAIDIAFTIERDLFNNGKLDYISFSKKHSKKIDDPYFNFEWKLGQITIFFYRLNDILALGVYTKFQNAEDNEEIICNFITAEDGIIEYKFGGDSYPQGCEIVSNDKEFIKPLPLDDFTFRTVKVRVDASNERLNELTWLLKKMMTGENIVFLGVIMDKAFVFVETTKRIVLPMTQYEDRKNILLGYQVAAQIDGFDTENLGTYVGVKMQIMTSKQPITKPTNLPIYELYSYHDIPPYVYGLLEHYKPSRYLDSISKIQKQDEQNSEIYSRTRYKTLSISFNEYDLSNSNLEYLKSCANDSSIEFKLSLKIDKRKREYISVESINSDYPLSTEIKDECFIEDFKKHEQLVQKGKATGKCYGVLFHYQDANSEFSSSQRIFFHIKVYMPWTQYKEIPAVPQTQQKIPSLETKNAGMQKYIANLVGFKFCLKENELEEVDKYFYDFNNVIYLKPESDNPFDPNAIAAYMDNGKKIAYVAKENAQVLRPLLQEDEEIEAQPDRFDFTSAVIRMNLPCNKSLEMECLFSEYKPIEVYKAHYLNVYWGGTDSLVERNIFNSNEQFINFENLLSLPIEKQNYLAVEWKDCMNKVSVENPTNLGLKMNIHLDLSIYGTSLEEIDLSDIELLDRIEEDNKKTALFVRLSRERYVSSPKEFIEEHCPDACDTLKQRLQYEYNKIRK